MVKSFLNTEKQQATALPTHFFSFLLEKVLQVNKIVAGL